MKFFPFIVPSLLLLMVSCDQQQSQIIALKDDFQRQLRDKEQQINDTKQKMLDLENQNRTLQGHLAEAGKVDPAVIAEAVKGSVDKSIAPVSEDVASVKQKVDALTTQLVAIQKAINSGAVASAPAQSQGGPSSPPPSTGRSQGEAPRSGNEPPVLRQKNDDDGRVKAGRFDF